MCRQMALAPHQTAGGWGGGGGTDYFDIGGGGGSLLGQNFMRDSRTKE